MIDSTLAAALVLEHEPVIHHQVVSGSPSTGIAELGEFGGHAYGVWEMTPGAMSDVEDDELFIVLFGAATVEFVSEDRASEDRAGEDRASDERTLELVAGSVVTLVAGTRTIWTLTETLRKVWIAG